MPKLLYLFLGITLFSCNIDEKPEKQAETKPTWLDTAKIIDAFVTNRYDSIYSGDPAFDFPESFDNSFQILTYKVEYILDGRVSDCSIWYPQIIGYKNKKIQSKINEEIRKVLHVSPEGIYDEFVSQYWVILNINYKVTYRNSNLLSILIDKYYHGGGSGSFNEKKGLIFDLTTGQRLEIEDVLQGTSVEDISNKVQRLTNHNIEILPDYLESMILTKYGIRFMAEDIVIPPNGPMNQPEENPVAVLIPFEKLKPILSDNFLKFLEGNETL